MAKVLLYLSIGLSLLTAAGGFLTKQKIDAVNLELTGRRTDVKNLTVDKQRLTADVKKAGEDVAAANKVVEEQKSEVETAKNDAMTAKADAEKAKGGQTEAEGKLAQVQTDLDAANKKIADMPAAANPLSPDLKAENDKMKAELAESRQVQDTLKQRAQGLEEKTASLSKQLDRYLKQVQRPGIMGRVVAVNSGWNFVVVDVGDKRGATLNAPLIVTRGGQTVARLKITQVEPSSSIADVVPGTMIRGQSVQPGDTVIFAGRQNMTPAPADDAAPAGATPAAAGVGASAMTQ